jgi:hypothetical protein
MEQRREMKEEIRNIFCLKVKEGATYTVLAGGNVVATRRLMKTENTYYNYLIGYRDGDDPEIVIISTSADLGMTEDPVICKRSACTQALREEDGAEYRILHPAFGGESLNFRIITSARGQAEALVIPVAYGEEFFSFDAFFRNRFAK